MAKGLRLAEALFMWPGSRAMKLVLTKRYFFDFLAAFFVAFFAGFFAGM
jgi:hypothetical protein